MTGPEHYREAERMVTPAANMKEIPPERLARAQVHATFALAAATAFPAIAMCHGSDSEPVREEARQWSQVTS